MSDWPSRDYDPPEHVFSINISRVDVGLAGPAAAATGRAPVGGEEVGVDVGVGAGSWWTSDGAWTAAQALGIVLVGTLGVVVNVLCALIWSGRPALRSHSTRYVYNMLAANLLCAGLLAPLDVAVLLLAPGPPPPGPPAAPAATTASGDLLWPGASAAAAAAAAVVPDAQVTVSSGTGVAAALVGPAGAAGAWSRPWGLWLRDVNRFAQALAVQVSVFSVLLVALDRHKAVLSPLHYHRMATRQRSTILIVSNWLLTPAVTALFETRLIPYSQWIHFAIGFAAPLHVIVYMYVQMSLAAHRNSKRTRRHSVCASGQMSLDAGSGSRGGSRGGSLDLTLPPFTGTPEHPGNVGKGEFPRRPGRNPPLGSIVLNSKRRCSNASFSTLLLREEGRAVKTALFVVGAYLACWTPYFVFVLLQRPSPPSVLLLAHVNSCVSPWIYVLRNEEARLEARKLVARALHLRLPGQPHESPHSPAHYGRSDSGYSKSMEASMTSHPAHPLRQQSSHCDSMSVQSFHTDLTNPLSSLVLSGYHGVGSTPAGAGANGAPHGPLAGALGLAGLAGAGTDSPLTAESLCSAGESPGPATAGGPGHGRVAYKYPAQYQQYAGHLQRGRSQTCVRQNSDSSSGSGRPLLQSDQLQQGRCGRRRLGSSGDSGSDQETPRHGGFAGYVGHVASLEEDGSPPPLTPPDRDRVARRKLLPRDSLEEEDEDQLSPTRTPPAVLAAALRRMSGHGHGGPPPTPPRRSSLSSRRGSLKIDGNIFQFDNIPPESELGLDTAALSGESCSAEPVEQSSTVSGDSGICLASNPECMALSRANSLAMASTHPMHSGLAVLRPPPPPRNKLKRIEAIEELVCDTTFTTFSLGSPGSPDSPGTPDSPADSNELQHPSLQQNFQLWATNEFSQPSPSLSPHHQQQSRCIKPACKRGHKMVDIRNLVKTNLHRPAFRIPKADF